MRMMILDLLENIAILMTLCMGYTMIHRRWDRQSTTGQVILGVVFGAATIVGMMCPAVFSPGILFDGRSVLISVVGLFGGWLPALIAAAIACSGRIVIGGVGVFLGCWVIITSAVLGLGYHYVRRRNVSDIGNSELFAFGFVVQSLLLVFLLAFPVEIRWQVFRSVALPILLAYPVGTVIVGRLLADQGAWSRSKRALQESEANLRTFMENARGFGVYRVEIAEEEPFGVRTAFASSSVREILGVETLEDNASWFENIHPDEKERVTDVCFASRATGEGFDQTFRIFHPRKREWRWIRAISSAVQGPGGSFTHFNGHFNGLLLDVSDIKRAEAELTKTRELLEEMVSERTAELAELNAQQRVILNGVRAGIWYKDTKNNVLRVNKAAAASVGMSAEEIEGKSVFDLFPDVAEKFFEDDLEVIRTGKPMLEIVDRMKIASGETRWFLTDKIPHFGAKGEVTGLTVFAIDITERKRAQDEMERHSEELRNIVRSMAGRENRMVELKETIEKLRAQLDRAGIIPIADDPMNEDG